MSQTSILYLDDEDDNLIAFRAVFRRSYTVYTTTSVAEAREYLKNYSIQIIISDQRMPGMTGVEFLTEVSVTYPDVLRMIMTGYTDMQSIIDAINKGKIYYYISKPWKFEELKIILENAIETQKLRDQNITLIQENHDLIKKSLEFEKSQLQAQLEVLKNQVNPHFLFNCLNTLASLITSDPEAAVRYTTKFSKLYRMSIEHSDEKLIGLEKELEFLNAYIFLQKIRYSENLRILFDINNPQSYFIPPFALQLLVENALKHNVISKEKPLEIFIIQKNDKIAVTNEIQRRQSSEPSTGTGLKNLMERFTLLTGKGIQVNNDGQKFEAIVPLILEI